VTHCPNTTTFLRPPVLPDYMAKLILGEFRDSPYERTILVKLNAEGRAAHIYLLGRGNGRSVPAPSYAIMRRLLSPGTRAVLLHNHPSGGTDFSQADIELASTYHNDLGLGFGVVVLDDQADQGIRIVMLCSSTGFSPSKDVLPCH